MFVKSRDTYQHKDTSFNLTDKRLVEHIDNSSVSLYVTTRGVVKRVFERLAKQEKVVFEYAWHYPNETGEDRIYMDTATAKLKSDGSLKFGCQRFSKAETEKLRKWANGV